MFFLYTATIFLSAFLVQPMVGKIFLPWVGGAPAVWNTCMFFFQILLLSGYYYTHISLKKLTVKRQMLVHFIIMGTAILTLPIAFSGGSVTSDNPAFWLLKQLFSMVALPFFILSSTAPLLQKWFFYTTHSRAKNPFFLYAASNAGSLLALLCYPFLMEPKLNVLAQTRLWSWGFGGLFLLMLACASFVKAPETSEAQEPTEPIDRSSIRRWVLAAFIPTTLFLSVTQHITTDIAPVPMIWIVPLMIYLLTFILAFSESIKLNEKYLRIMGLASVILFFPTYYLELVPSKKIMLLLHLLILFVLSLICHKSLNDTKPKAESLTVFYLWVSLGGALGGLFNSFLAPNFFDGNMEYPVAILLSTVFLAPLNLSEKKGNGKIFLNSLVYAAAIAAFAWTIKFMPIYQWSLHNVTYFSLGIEYDAVMTNLKLLLTYADEIRIILFLFLSFYSVYQFFKSRKFSFFLFTAFTMCFLFFIQIGIKNPTILRARNFFGTKEVIFNKFRDQRQLRHGTTFHGKQSMVPEFRYEPSAYYHRNGPLGHLFAHRGQEPGASFGMVGLGIGTAAAYCLEGQEMRFYEIDPEVVSIAKDENLFTYLSDCVGSCSVIIGDARLKLEEEDNELFDILILDAFSSDYIPMHLMTVEAVEMYLKKIKKDGLLVFHISNRYLSLTPLMVALAKQFGLECSIADDRRVKSDNNENWQRLNSIYAVLSKGPLDLPQPSKEMGYEWKPQEDDMSIIPWTDGFSSLAPLLAKSRL